MNSSRSILGSVALACLWACCGGSLLAQQSTNPPAGAAAPRRMRVIETRAGAATTGATYSIVGAVTHSGVYATFEPTLSVRQLIDAAGGLTSDASSTLRVVRNGTVRFQIAAPAGESAVAESLLPGDILVVPCRMPVGEAAAPAPEIVPVACVGLLERPVVLPLDPSIRTVNELVRRLLQHPDLATSAVVIDPVRGSATNALTSGTVIVFNPAAVDRHPFQQPGALPAAIDLDRNRTSAVPGVMPADAELPPPAPAVPVVQAQGSEMIAPPLPPGSGRPRQDQMVAAAAHASEIPDSSRPIARTSAEFGTGTDVTLPLPPDLAHALDLFSTERDSPSEPAIVRQTAELAEVRDLQPTPVLRQNTFAPAASDAQLTFHATPPAESSQATDASQNDLAGAIAPESAEHSKMRSQSSRLQYLLFCGAGLSILIGVSLLLTLVTSSPSPGIDPPETAVTPAQAKSTTEIPAQGIKAPAPAIDIASIPQRPLPLVEEAIQVPSAWPLHGQVIGHRRVILNSAHEGVPGPHFSNARQSRRREKISVGTAKAAERQLRQNLKEICRPSWDPNEQESALEESAALGITPSTLNKSPPSVESTAAASERTPPRDTPSSIPASPAFVSIPQANAPAGTEPTVFDIVQPQPSAQTTAMSPLERALRTLASEKRG